MRFTEMAAADRGFTLLAASVAVLFVASLTFATLALAFRVLNDRRERESQRLTELWEPVMLEVLAGSAPDDALKRLVTPSDTRVFLSFLTGYARRLRGNERATVRRLALPLLPHLTSTLRRGSVEKRGLAVHRLAEIGLPECAEAVAEALEDDSPAVAVIAARGLFRPGHERYFPAVLAQISRFAHLSRTFLASVLSQGGPGAAPPLRAIFADPCRGTQVRAVVADALTLLNDVDAVPIAAAYLDTTRDRELLTASLRLVRQLGHHEHLVVVEPLVHSPDPVIRAAAVGALAGIGSQGEVRLLQDALDDEHFWVSLQAARGLMALGDLETLRRLAASDGAWAVLARQVLSE